jgi:hypothetical protein
MGGRGKRTPRLDHSSNKLRTSSVRKPTPVGWPMRCCSADRWGGTQRAMPGKPAPAVSGSQPAAGGATMIHRPPSGMGASTIVSKASFSTKNRRLRSWSRTQSVANSNRRKGCKSAALSDAARGASTPSGCAEGSIATDYSISSNGSRDGQCACQAGPASAFLEAQLAWSLGMHCWRFDSDSMFTK